MFSDRCTPAETLVSNDSATIKHVDIYWTVTLCIPYDFISSKNVVQCFGTSHFLFICPEDNALFVVIIASKFVATIVVSSAYRLAGYFLVVLLSGCYGLHCCHICEPRALRNSKHVIQTYWSLFQLLFLHFVTVLVFSQFQ